MAKVNDDIKAKRETVLTALAAAGIIEEEFE